MNVLRAIHQLTVLIGVIVLGTGIALLFAPDLAASLPFNLLAADLAAIGAFILCFWVIRARSRSDSGLAIIPDVEFPLFTSTPGDDLDTVVYRLTRLREGTIEYREQIHERVREIASAVIMERESCSYEQALKRLENGDWTENRSAAGFFTAPGGTLGSDSVLDRLGQWFSNDDETAYEEQLRETVSAIEEYGGFPDEGATDTDDVEEVRAMPQRLADHSENTEQVTDTVKYSELAETNHWKGVSAFGFAAFGVGVLTTQPAILLASVIGVALAGYARIASAPPLADLEVTRTVSDETPEPGDEIEVTVTVENESGTFLTDLRMIDNIPPTMRVVDGSPRLGTALRPNGKATFSYELRVERGTYSWPLQVVGHDPSGALERSAFIDPETEIECVPRLKTTAEMPVRLQTSVYAGEVNTETGGEGLEFFSVRDYQAGDPKSRIDWKTYARTGEFSTIDFREEHAARVVLLFDARESSYVSSVPGDDHAMNKSLDAAFDVFASLYDQGHLIGIAAFNGIPCWLGPSTGSLHLQRVRELFTEHPALSPLPPSLVEEEEGRYVDPMVHIRRQLPENTQIFLFSPLTDHYTYEVGRRLNGAGHLVTIISPDPTATRTTGQRIARLEREVRLKQLREHGIRVIDWDTDRPLNLELEHASRRWQA